MKIMVVGGGGREHAIIKSLKKSPKCEKIYALPGNGGIAADAECVAIGAKEIDKIVEFAKANAIDFAVVAPDDARRNRRSLLWTAQKRGNYRGKQGLLKEPYEKVRYSHG